eukprot:TRINITY_DN14737_c0_g1_i2.p1 TRINITY_DN14737_c0_g1~~TRINITY_DN14737_c0_g1_i2.p1  ORF type:complete len:291 (-),score=47.66 TRINITY_DN14737_c0_g1_i2:357-1229(-)
MFITSQNLPSTHRRSYFQPRIDYSAQRRHHLRISAIACLDGLSNCARQVKLSFQLPYRCQFGQQLCIVGNTEHLGLWDVKKGLSMEWSTGDVWKADIELFARTKMSLEYKYVVKNKDGSPAVWKPGDNFCLDVPKCQLQVPSECLRITDGWDGVQQVELESDCQTQIHTDSKTNFQDSAMLEESEQKQVDVSQLQPVSSALEMAEPPPQPPKKVSQIQTMQETVNRAFEDLEIAIDESIRMIERSGDVSAKEAIQSDRMVATMAKRAITLQKALQTSQPPSHLLLEEREN